MLLEDDGGASPQSCSLFQDLKKHLFFFYFNFKKLCIVTVICVCFLEFM